MLRNGFYPIPEHIFLHARISFTDDHQHFVRTAHNLCTFARYRPKMHKNTVGNAHNNIVRSDDLYYNIHNDCIGQQGRYSKNARMSGFFAVNLLSAFHFTNKLFCDIISLNDYHTDLVSFKGVKEVEIDIIGYDYSHGTDFEINRPDGLGCWLILLIKSPALFTIDGKSVNVRPNSFIALSPDIPYKYHGTDDIYTDDWVHFNADNNDLRYFEKLHIPINVPVYLGDISELSALINTITYEHYSGEDYSHEIERYYIEIFLLKLSRMIKTESSSSSHAYAERNRRMSQLRTVIITQPEKTMSVDEMAESMNMSRSGFQHLYKKLFGVSVIKDITRGRMDRAKRLLSSTTLTVGEISFKCGYTSEYGFMRMFKEQCGMTPTEYRKSLG